MGLHRRVDRVAEEKKRVVRGKNAHCASQVEPPNGYVSRSLALAYEQTGDEETAEHKERAYTEVSRNPKREIGVQGDDRKHRDCAQAIQGGQMRPGDDVAKESIGRAHCLDVLH